MTGHLIGTWRLLLWETRTADGEVSHPLGSDGLGYLSYTPDGYMFVVVMQHDRPNLATNDLRGGTPTEKAQAVSTFGAYCGRYEIRDGGVIHHIEMSLFPNWSGTDQERFVEVDGDRLTITTPPLQIGGTTFSRLVWERAR